MKGIIFDMDGVIFNTEDLWRDGFYLANKIYDIDLNEEYRKSICGKDELLIREELKKLYPNFNVDEYRDFIIKYVHDEINKGSFIIKPGFIEIINYLKDKNYKIALATSSDKSRAEKLFNLKNINMNIFDFMVFADDVKGRGKPDPYIFNLACKGLNLKKEDIYVIEDSINGIKAAYDGGFLPIMVIDLIEPNEYARKHTKYVLNNLNELKMYL